MFPYLLPLFPPPAYLIKNQNFLSGHTKNTFKLRHCLSLLNGPKLSCATFHTRIFSEACLDVLRVSCAALINTIAASLAFATELQYLESINDECSKCVPK